MKLLTTPEVAKKLGVTVSRVQALINEHRLPAQKLGRDFMVREEDLILVSARPAGRTPARLQLDYWSAFRNFLISNNSFLNPPEPKAQRYMVLETTRGCRLAASLHIKDFQIWVDLTFGRNRKTYFGRLEKDRESIEEEMGFEVEWVPRAEGVESWILVRKRADPANRDDWARQHTWLYEKLERFSTAFRARLITLR
jgi:excisionase family DNA binding protein